MSFLKVSSEVKILKSRRMSSFLSRIDEPTYVLFKSKLMAFFDAVKRDPSVSNRFDISRYADSFSWGLVGSDLSDNSMIALVAYIGGDKSNTWSADWGDLALALDSLRQPQAEVEQPQAEVEQPQAEVEQPQAEVEQPQAEVEQPQAEATPEGGDVRIFDSNEEVTGDTKAPTYPPIVVDEQEVRGFFASLGLFRPNAFSRESLRPGIPNGLIPKFASFLENKGITVTKQSPNVRQLGPSVSEDSLDYRSIIRRLREPIENSMSGPMLIGNGDDGSLLILEGNSRWATVYFADFKLKEMGEEGFSPMIDDCYMVDLPIDRLLRESKEWGSRLDVRRLMGLKKYEAIVDVSKDDTDKYDRFRFLPGGDLHVDIFGAGPGPITIPDGINALLSDIPDSFMSQAFGELEKLMRLYLQEMGEINNLRDEIERLKETSGSSMMLEKHEKIIYRHRHEIDIVKDTLGRLEASASVGAEVSLPEEQVTLSSDILDMDDSDSELPPIYADEIKRGTKRAMIDRQSRFRAQYNSSLSKGVEFDINSKYFASILEDASLTNFIDFSLNDDGESICVPRKDIFDKFIQACIFYISNSTSSSSSKVDLYKPINDFISAVKILEDQNILKIRDSVNVSDPQSWLSRGGISISGEMTRLDYSETDGMDGCFSAGRSHIFEQLKIAINRINGHNDFCAGDILDTSWRRRYLGDSVPPELEGEDKVYSSFKQYVGSMISTQITSIFNRNNYAKWNGGEYESDLLLCRSSIPQFKRNYLSDFVTNRSPGYLLVKCPMCNKKKEIEFGMSGWGAHKELKEEYRNDVKIDLFSPFTSGQNPTLITTEVLAGKDGDKAWDIPGLDDDITWSGANEMARSSDRSTSLKGHSSRSAILSMAGAKKIKSGVSLDSIRFRCPSGLGDDGCGLDYSGDAANGEINFQPTGSRTVYEETRHVVDVVIDDFDDLTESFAEFILRNAEGQGVSADEMRSRIVVMNNLDDSIDDELFDEAGGYIVSHESLRNALSQYLLDGETIDDAFINKLRENNFSLRKIYKNEDIISNLDNNHWGPMVDAHRSGGIVVDTEETSEGRSLGDADSGYLKKRKESRSPGFKYSRMTFPCPCHIKDPPIDASKRFSLLAIPHSGPAGISDEMDSLRTNPTLPNGELSALEQGTFGYLICGVATSLSSFTRNPDNENNIRKFLEKNKVAATEFLIENGVSADDLIPFLEEMGTYTEDSEGDGIFAKSERLAQVGRLFKDAMSKLFRGDMLKGLEDLSLTCAHGHVFTIGQSWDFSSSHFGINLQSTFSARGTSDNSKLVRRTKFDYYNPIIRTSGFENLANTLRIASDGSYSSGIFRSISDGALNTEGRLEWKDKLRSGELKSDSSLSGSYSWNKLNATVLIPEVTHLPKESIPDDKRGEYIFLEDINTDDKHSRAEIVDTLVKMKGSYSIRSIDVQGYINSQYSSYDAQRMKRGKKIISEIIERYISGKSDHSGAGDDERGDPLENLSGGDYSLLYQSGRSSSSYYISAEEYPIGSKVLYNKMLDVVSNGMVLVPRLLSLKRDVASVNNIYDAKLKSALKGLTTRMSIDNRTRTINNERRKVIEGMMMEKKLFSNKEVASWDQSSMTHGQEVAMIGKSPAEILELSDSVFNVSSRLVTEQIEDLSYGLKSYLNLVNKYFLNAKNELTFSFLRSTSSSTPQAKQPPESDELLIDVKDLVSFLIQDGALSFAAGTPNDERLAAIGEFSGDISRYISSRMSSDDIDSSVNLNNVLFKIEKSLTYNVSDDDTVDSIAKRFGVGTASVKKWNGLSASSDEAVDSAIRGGSISSFDIKASVMSGIRDFLSNILADGVSSVSGNNSEYFEIAKKAGGITSGLLNHVTAFAIGMEDPEDVAYNIMFSLTKPGMEDNAASSIRGSVQFSEPEEGSDLYNAIVGEFSHLETLFDDGWDPSDEERASEYKDGIIASLNRLIGAGMLNLTSKESIPYSEIRLSIDDWISRNDDFSSKFSPDRDIFGDSLKRGGASDGADISRVISSNITTMSFAVYLASELVRINNIYFKKGSSKYIGIDIGISDHLSDIDSILNTPDSYYDKVVGSRVDKGQVDKLIAGFENHAASYITDHKNMVWGPMAEAFLMMNRAISRGKSCMSKIYTDKASDILMDHLSDTDYFNDPIRSLVFHRASSFKSIPMSSSDPGFKETPAMYGHMGTGKKARPRLIRDLEDSEVVTQGDTVRVINERLNYDSSNLSIGRIGQPGTFDYKYPPKEGSYKGSVGLSFPLSLEFKEKATARSRLPQIGSNLIIPDFKIVIEIPDNDLKTRGRYDISFLVKRKGGLDDAYKKLSIDSEELSALKSSLEAKSILMEASDSQNDQSLVEESGLIAEKILSLESSIRGLQEEALNMPPDIKTNISNRLYVTTGGGDSVGSMKDYEPGSAEVVSVPCIILVNPYMAYRLIQNPDMSGSPYGSDEDKRVLTRFIYSVYNFEPIARSIFSPNLNDSDDFYISYEQICSMLDTDKIGSLPKVKGRKPKVDASSNPGMYYRIIQDDDLQEGSDPNEDSDPQRSGGSYIRYMPTRLKTEAFRKSLAQFRSAIDASESQDDFSSMLSIQRVLKSYNYSLDVDSGMWSKSVDSIALYEFLGKAWCHGGDSLNDYIFNIKQIPEEYIVKSQDVSMPGCDQASLPAGDVRDMGKRLKFFLRKNNFSSKDWSDMVSSMAKDLGLLDDKDHEVSSADTFSSISGYAAYTSVVYDMMSALVRDSSAYFYNSAYNRARYGSSYDNDNDTNFVYDHIKYFSKYSESLINRRGIILGVEDGADDGAI